MLSTGAERGIRLPSLDLSLLGAFCAALRGDLWNIRRKWSL
jgi:hypothetical protein